MLSRVANSIYWMSRYLERADNVARFVRVNIHLLLDLGLERKNSRWTPLVYASGDHKDFYDRYSTPSEACVLRFLTFDEKNPNSILSCIVRARENARTIRENIPSEMWESINELYHITKKHSRKRRIDDLQSFYERIQLVGLLITGYAQDTMTHAEAWHFSRLGRMLERADKTARLMDIKYFIIASENRPSDTAFDNVEWGALLKSVNAVEMYRKEHHAFNYRDVAQFLLFNERIPRSVTFCINAAAESLTLIAGSGTIDSPARKEMQTLWLMLANTDVDYMLSSGLHEFIDVFQYNLNVVDESIHQSFFAELT